MTNTTADVLPAPTAPHAPLDPVYLAAPPEPAAVDDDAPSSRVSSGLLRQWGRGWLAVAQVICSLPLSILSYAFVMLVVVCVSTIPVFLIGVPLLAGWLWSAHWLTRLDHAFLTAFHATPLPPRCAQNPAPSGLLNRLKHQFLQVNAWKAVAYRVFHTLWGFVMGVLITVLSAWALYALLTPALRPFAAPTGMNSLVGSTLLTRDHHFVLMFAAGLFLVVTLPYLARAIVFVNVVVARALICEDPEKRIQDLSDRVDTLTDTRDKVLTSVEAERRRIERDLHDGPQQRLVATAMDIGMARTHVRDDQPELRAALDRAHANAKDAIVDMRQVARGIAPPILTDRGLSAALSALAARTPVPVTITVNVPERLGGTIEAVAYFVVSESLTNVAKHSHARNASVDVTHQGHTLIVTVSDNGVGNANPTLGTGLVGLTQRVNAVDGTLVVNSPDGGPTVVTATIPLKDPA